VCLFPVGAWAQQEVGVWKGELQGDAQIWLQGYTVELVDNRNHQVATADVQSDGAFEFHHVPSGDYQLTVSDRHSRVLYQGYVTAPGTPGDLQIRLPEDKVERPPSGSVSLSQLLHPPDRKALACFKIAQKLTAAGQYADSAAQLEKAVRISPEFADAYTNLGAQYIRLGRYREASDTLEHARQLAPRSPLTLSNLAYAQHMLSRDDEAIQTARQSLDLDPEFLPAHYVLGIVLATSGKSVLEAITHLEKAAAAFPTARINLERLRAYWTAQE
jgi:tetratricopeptide (TPR) repeat protein